MVCARMNAPPTPGYTLCRRTLFFDNFNNQHHTYTNRTRSFSDKPLLAKTEHNNQWISIGLFSLNQTQNKRPKRIPRCKYKTPNIDLPIQRFKRIKNLSKQKTQFKFHGFNVKLFALTTMQNYFMYSQLIVFWKLFQEEIGYSMFLKKVSLLHANKMY